MKKTQFVLLFALGLVLTACTAEKASLKEQFVEMDSLLTEQYNEAFTEGNTEVIDSLEKLYVENLFNLVLNNADDEWVDSLLLISFRQFTPEQKDSILNVLPNEVMQGEIMQALVSKYEVEKATSEGNMYIDIAGLQPDGTELKLSELVGKTDYVLLDFWATWCAPCRQLLPSLKELYTNQPESKLEVLGVNCDEDKQAWKTYVEQQELSWRHITTGDNKSNSAYETYGVDGIPTTILIDKEGKIVHRSYGDEAAIREIIEK